MRGKAKRVRMQIDTEVEVWQHATAQITERAKQSFRPSAFRIMDHPAEWIVQGLSIGDRHVWKGFAHGRSFARTTPWEPLVDQVVRRGQPVALIVSYVGRRKGGRPFRGMITGSARRSSSKESTNA